MFGIDENSVAYQMGYERGFEGLSYRNPCSGNKIAENNFYFGFIKGKATLLGVPYNWIDPTPEWMDKD